MEIGVDELELRSDESGLIVSHLVGGVRTERSDLVLREEGK